MAAEQILMLGSTAILLEGVRSIGTEQGTVVIRMSNGDSYSKIYATASEAEQEAADLVQAWKDFLAYQ